VASQIKKVVTQFGGGEVTFVGDRGMLKSAQIEQLAKEGFHYITAITKPQIEVLLNITVVDGAGPFWFCSERTWLGLGGSGASWTSAAPLAAGAPGPTTAPQRSGALQPHSPSAVDGNGRQ
jgi:hypothetical protein